MFVQARNAAGITLYTGATAGGAIVLSADWQRVSFTTVELPADAVTVGVIFRLRTPGSAASGGFMEVDRAQLELGSTVTGWRDNGQANIEAAAANTQATTVLTGRVEKTEQGLAANSTQVTQLGSRLDTTNQNVSNAQSAAQAASDLAGSKGKVLVQSTAPAAVDRLLQNLWIDTTGNANTPKRWRGSAWVAVTDKVATDAAAAAASALAEVAKKADASALQTLGTTVSQLGKDTTAQGQSITDIHASLSTAGGENLLYNPSFERGLSFDSSLADGWLVSTQATVATSIVDSTLDAKGKAQRLDMTNLTAGTGERFAHMGPRTYALMPKIIPGQVLAASAYVRGTAGLLVQLYTQARSAANQNLASYGPFNLVLDGTWQRVTLVSATFPQNAASANMILGARSAPGSTLTAGFVEWDRAQLEIGSVVTGWRDNNTLTDVDIAANATATTALTGRVSQTEQGLSSASNQVTELSNSIGDVGGENLFYNPTFNKHPKLEGPAEGWELEGPATVAEERLVTSWINSAEKAHRVSLTRATSGTVYKSIRTIGDKRISVAAGQTVTASAYARRGGDPMSMRILIQWFNSAGAVLSAPNSLASPLTTTGDRLQFSAVVPTGAVKAHVYFRVYGPSSTASNGVIELARPQAEYGSRATGWRDNGQVAAAQHTETSAAVDSLSSAVSQHGNTLSSVSGRTTSLENGLTTTNGNVATAQSAAQAASDLAGSKGKVFYQSIAPAIADRLTQNLWIDTTGGANTPKRWSGSAWVAVTDKVATDASAAAQSALTQVATKASASSVDALTQRITTQEGVTTSQAESLVSLKAAIEGVAPFTGSPASWEFIGSLNGFVVNVQGGSPTLTANPAFARINGAGMLRRSGFSVDGTIYPLVRIRMRRSFTGRATGSFYWGNQEGGLAEARRVNFTIDTSTIDWQTIEVDLSGHSGWDGKTIKDFRIDMTNSGDASAVIDVAYVSIGNKTPAGSASALSSTQVLVEQQGVTLTAESKRIDTLGTSVGNTSAAVQNEVKARSDADSALSTRIDTAQAAAGSASTAVQNEATARANADAALGRQVATVQANLGNTNASVQQIATAQVNLNGRVNAQYTMRVHANDHLGVHHWAGFGIGIDNSSGTIQSTFAVYSDQFAILNSNGGGLSSPFAVVGNQTFISDAYIRSASITAAKIADASISRAKIENGAISAAKIGIAEIDTLRIRGNAVTVPVSANNPNTAVGAGENQWKELIAVTVQMDEGGYILAQFGCYQGFGSGIRKYHFQMMINGLLLAQGGGDWADGFPNLLGSIGVAAGTFVISVRWWGENPGVRVQNMTLYALGAKR
uniref:phage tail tip fiber protein n=1 Tax=Pseudomonas capeferrum TaxID=1495066 RepID=UPI00280AEC52|nr:DUF1983 domain-containing protein [Pseudomonas capeferrum]